ncbi:MAG: recombinase family protein [Christensenellales bacterium]
MKYAYLRVSSTDQSLSRQIDAVKKFAPDLKDERIFYDKQSGKNFDRAEYQKLKSVVSKGDEVIIMELDRLGRDKDGIKSELQWFKESGVIVRILDVPTTLIDFQGQDWIADMVNNVIIEVMGAVAEQERLKIRKRQREGINSMPIVNGKRVSTRTGNSTGRPRKELPNFEKIAKKQKEGLITVVEACSRLGISRAQWYRLIKEVA